MNATLPVTTTEKSLTPAETFRRNLDAMGPQFEMVLPQHIPVDRFKRVVATAVLGNPDLMKADKAALFAACMAAAQDGLLPDKRESVIMMFKGKATYMPMVYGIIKKMRNVGVSVTAHVVHAADEFRYILGDNESIEHVPSMDEDRGAVVAAYAIARIDGTIERDVMLRPDIEKRRKASAAANGPWVSWYEEMACKTVIKHLAKRLPMSTEIETILRRDDALFAAGNTVGNMVGTQARDQVTAPASDPFLAASQGRLAPPDTKEEEEEHDPETGEIHEPEATEQPAGTMPDLPAELDRRPAQQTPPAKLSPVASRALDRLRDSLTSEAFQVEVQGWTDEIKEEIGMERIGEVYGAMRGEP